MFRSTILAAVLLWGSALSGSAQGPGTVKRMLKLSHNQGGAMPPLDDFDQIGRAVANIGDLDGDGVIDLAAPALGDDDGGLNQGAVYILFLNADGRVRAHQKISELAGGFTGNLRAGDQMGRAVANLGDLDGDGITDIAAGANYDDDGGSNRGAVWVLFLNSNGTVKRTAKISSLSGGFVGPLRNTDEFGRALAPLGDLDGDGVLDLAVGAPTDSTGGTRRGAVWILFLNPDGTVKGQSKIASGRGGFLGRLKNLDWFGFSLGNLGDLDGDGVIDLAVGAALDDDGYVNAGAVWILFLRPDGTVKGHQKISTLSGGFTGVLEATDQFGFAVTAQGDLNADGITELAVGAPRDSDGGFQNGAVYQLFLRTDGTVAFHQKLSDLEGGLRIRLTDEDWFGSALASLGDLDRDGVSDLLIGSRNDDDGGAARGSMYETYVYGTPANLLAESPQEPAGPALFPEGAAPSGVPGGPRVRFSGPEPEGSLMLLPAESVPGETLVFGLCSVQELPGLASARLLIARGPARVPAGPTGGLLLDPRALLHGTSGRPLPGGGDWPLRLELDLPRDGSLAGERWSVQGVWFSSDGGPIAFTDALEFDGGR